MKTTHRIFDILEDRNVATLPDHLHAYWTLETTIGGTHVFTTVDFANQQVFATYIPTSVEGPAKGIVVLISDDDDPKLLQEKFEGLYAAQEWLDRTVSKILEDEIDLL